MLSRLPLRVKNILRFQVERLLVRGPFSRLLVIAVLIVLVATAAGVSVYVLSPGFAHVGEAIWWAFLRLSDPGYLGDDVGTARRIISTAVTVLGYVLFLGALIAIMTQWLNQTMARLQSGLTPIAQRNHIVILGWTNRTATMVQELLLSEERVERFLQRRGSRTLTIAILAETVDPALVQDLRERLGPLWNARQIVLRSGSPLRIEHLNRVDFLHAGAVLLPAGDIGASSDSTPDGRTIKALLAAAGTARSEPGAQLPLVVAEVLDGRKVPIARRAYGGPIELLPSDLFVSRLIAQNLRHPGLSHVYTELLTHQSGNEIYLREAPTLAGCTLGEAAGAFPSAVLLGLARAEGDGIRPYLNPPPGLVIERDDRLVLVATSIAASAPARGFRWDGVAPSAVRAQTPAAAPAPRRVLVLGWNHKVPALIREFEGYAGETFEVDILALQAPDERALVLERREATPEQVKVRQLHGDFTSRSDLRRVNPAEYDNVVLVASDWVESEVESDARTILGYLLLHEILPAEGPRPNVLVELVDPENVSLFRPRTDEVLISPLVLSHILAQVALRRELNGIFDELFGPKGAEIGFRSAAAYGLDTGSPVSFRDVQAAATARGETALGVRLYERRTGARGGVALNPGKDRSWPLRPEDEVVVLGGPRPA